MDLQERYDELDEIIDTLDTLINNISDEDYKLELRETMYRAMNEKDEIEPRLMEERDAEERQQEREYWRMVI